MRDVPEMETMLPDTAASDLRKEATSEEDKKNSEAPIDGDARVRGALEQAAEDDDWLI